MKLIVDSTVRAKSKNITLSEEFVKLTFLIRDVMTLDRYQRLVHEHGIPDMIISEAHPEYMDINWIGQNTDYLYSPYWLTTQANMLTANSITINDHDTEHCFNFMINKKQINRYLLLKLVEWFGLSSYRYTWSGIGANFDMSGVLDNFDLLKNQVEIDKFRHFMLSPVCKILPYFINTDLTLNTHTDNDMAVVNYNRNDWVWNNVVGDIFSKSAVSLISESVAYEKTIVFTEKTLYSVLGLTFPIWIGGYRQADFWKKHGFDTFDDIINHNYQYYDTLLERCYYAIHDNLKILTDLDHARSTKHKYIDRLKQNRCLLKANIGNIYNMSISKLPIVDLWTIINDQTPINTSKVLAQNAEKNS